MPSVADLKVKIFADGADKAGMLEMYHNPTIQGFTTNPTLMRKAGISDYEAFPHDILHAIPLRPLSSGVFSDEMDRRDEQPHLIAPSTDNVDANIPLPHP